MSEENTGPHFNQKEVVPSFRRSTEATTRRKGKQQRSQRETNRNIERHLKHKNNTTERDRTKKEREREHRDRDRDIERREYNNFSTQSTSKTNDDRYYPEEDCRRNILRSQDNGENKKTRSLYRKDNYFSQREGIRRISTNKNRSSPEIYHEDFGTGTGSDCNTSKRQRYEPRQELWARQNSQGEISEATEKHNGRHSATQKRHLTARCGENYRRGDNKSVLAPDYIRTLVRFNKKTLLMSNHRAIVATFLSIAKEACSPAFGAKSLSMLFVGAKKYGIKYSDWINDIISSV